MSALGNVVRRRMRCRAKSVDQSRGKGDTFRHSTAQQRPQAGNAPRSQIPATHDQTQAGGDSEHRHRMRACARHQAVGGSMPPPAGRLCVCTRRPY
ncbi:MAG TPA: hypothetical protein VN614_08950, partial [Rhodanobacter sp.]|nr:hypothetical protein [Rhodanobacter sp.]